MDETVLLGGAVKEGKITGRVFRDAGRSIFTNRFICGISIILLDLLTFYFSFWVTGEIFNIMNLKLGNIDLVNNWNKPEMLLPVAVIIFSFLIRDLYSMKPYLFWEEMHRVLKSSIISAIVIMLVYYIENIPGVKSFVTASFVIFVLFDLFIRYAYRIIIFKTGLVKTNVVIIGAGFQGQEFENIANGHKFTTYNFIGYIDDHNEKINGNKVIGKIEEIKEIIRKFKIDEVVVAIPQAKRKELFDIMEHLEGNVKVIKFIPDMYGLCTFSTEINDYDKVLTISAKQGLLNPAKRIYKRLFDIIFGTIGMIVLIPIYIAAWIIIKKEDGGNVIFTQDRIGIKGKRIKIYKFRTMVPDAERLLKELMEKNPEIKNEYETNKKLENDPRITKIGRILRKTSLDEFPQFINVIKGEMSIVGPRPYLFGEIKDMGDKYPSIIKTKPGITGLWQATGRNDIPFDERTVLDQYYVRNWSVWFDIVIIMKTITSIFNGK